MRDKMIDPIAPKTAEDHTRSLLRAASQRTTTNRTNAGGVRKYGGARPITLPQVSITEKADERR